MSDVDKSGGVPVIMNELLNAGLLHGDVLTVTGKTVAENLAAFDAKPDSRVIYPASAPRSPTGGLVILRGNLAPEGAVMKVSGDRAEEPRGAGARLRRGARVLQRGHRRRDQGR